MKNKSYAIVLAAGSGTRYTGDNKSIYHKHTLELLDIPIIAWVLNSIIKSKVFSEVFIVTKKDFFILTKEICKKYFPNENFTFVEGSDERIVSFLNGLKKLENENKKIQDNDIIALFDANRPLIPFEDLITLNELAIKHGCVCPTRSVVDGISKVSGDRIIEIPDKEKFISFQTPEFINYKILNRSLLKTNVLFKSLVEFALNVSVFPKVFTCSELYKKLTYTEDLPSILDLTKKHSIKFEQ